MNLEDRLYQLLISYGPMTRNELITLTQIPRSTIYDSLVKLMLNERVVRYSPSNENKGKGRKCIYFKAIDSDGGSTI